MDIKGISDSFKIDTNYGAHTIEFEVTRGWGEKIRNWGMILLGNKENKTLQLKLGIDENSSEFHKILKESSRITEEEVRSYFGDTMRDHESRNSGMKPHHTERIAARTLLAHLQGRTLLSVPSIVVPMTVIASSHTQSLSAVEFSQRIDQLKQAVA